jgi:probable F420-dependent oxidoreductase
MRVGAKVPNFGPLPTEHGIPAMSRRLEAAGFDSLWISDHVVMPGTVTSRYPFSADGRATWDTDAPWYDAVVLLGMMAAVTERVELGVAVLLLPLRHPVVFAKQAASLDALSGGRLTLGVGAGWLAEEFDALAVPFDTRGSRLDEWMSLVRSVWTGRPPAHLGAHYDLPPDVRCFPQPAHAIELLVGGHTPAARRRAGRAGDGWLAQQSLDAVDPAELAAGQAEVVAAAPDDGSRRLVLRLVEAAGRPEDAAERLADLAAAGVSDVIVDVDWTDDGPERAAAALLPAARAAGNAEVSDAGASWGPSGPRSGER